MDSPRTVPRRTKLSSYASSVQANYLAQKGGENSDLYRGTKRFRVLAPATGEQITLSASDIQKDLNAYTENPTEISFENIHSKDTQQRPMTSPSAQETDFVFIDCNSILN